MPHQYGAGQRLGQLPHKRLVLIGIFPPQVVIQVSHQQSPRRWLVQRAQRSQQRDAVGAPGNGDDYRHLIPSLGWPGVGQQLLDVVQRLLHAIERNPTAGESKVATLLVPNAPDFGFCRSTLRAGRWRTCRRPPGVPGWPEKGGWQSAQLEI